MTIQYSIQPSSLSPPGITDPYGRYQVQVQNDTTVAISSTFATIANHLKAGDQVVILDSDDEPIGTIMPSLKGGFLLADSPSPTVENMSVGFRPSAELYNVVKQDVTFQRLDTVTRSPSIVLVSDWYENERTDGGISVGGGHSNYVEIKGTNLKLDSTVSVILTEIGGDETSVTLLNSESPMIKWTDRLISFNAKVSISTPASTGTLSVTVGTKTVSLVVNILNRL